MAVQGADRSDAKVFFPRSLDSWSQCLGLLDKKLRNLWDGPEKGKHKVNVNGTKRFNIKGSPCQSFVWKNNISSLAHIRKKTILPGHSRFSTPSSTARYVLMLPLPFRPLQRRDAGERHCCYGRCIWAFTVWRWVDNLTAQFLGSFFLPSKNHPKKD